MSKIKDLYAIENGDDDLVPDVKINAEQLSEILLAGVIRNNDNTEDYIADNAIYSPEGDADGEPYMVMDNFDMLCDQIAVAELDDYISKEHLELTDEEYSDIVATTGDKIADKYSVYSDKLCANETMDYNVDNKYLMQEMAERDGRC